MRCAHLGLGDAEALAEHRVGPGLEGEVPLHRVEQLAVDVVELVLVRRSSSCVLPAGRVARCDRPCSRDRPRPGDSRSPGGAAGVGGSTVASRRSCCVRVTRSVSACEPRSQLELDAAGRAGRGAPAPSRRPSSTPRGRRPPRRCRRRARRPGRPGPPATTLGDGRPVGCVDAVDARARRACA